MTRWLVPASVVAFALALSLPRLAGEKYNGDERWWIYTGERSWDLLCRGELHDPFWSESHLLYGNASPPVAKYVIGIGLDAFGKRSPVRDITSKKVSRTGEWYPRDVLWAARVPSAVLGALGILVFFLVARDATTGRAAAFAAGLLATSPVWLSCSRRAMVDIHGASLGLVSLWLFVAARNALHGGASLPRCLGWFAAVGVAVGLTVGAKFNAAGAALGAGALLLVDVVRARARGPRLRALASGTIMSAVAVGVFVGLYPYLHEDGWNRFTGILRVWREVRGLHVELGPGAFEDSYEPGLRSFAEAARLLLLPGGAALPWLVLPLAGAILFRTRWRERTSAESARLAVWILFLPGAIGALFAPGLFAHLWIAWVGLVGGLLVAIVPEEPRELEPRRRRAREAIAFYTLGSLAVVLATTTVTWARYYIALVPPVLLAAGVGLDGLTRDLVARGGRRAAAPVIAACAFAALSVVAAYPDPGDTKIVRLLENGWARPGALFLAGSVVSFCLFPAGFLRRARAPQAPGV
jgi:4-amino-4-deoxy-L-arabinose transferase-like glycosyltransferase